ncbi:uncharacterized protein LOC143629564 [Bidens hawaiensis]|uniref:uncharacterized protein LOC143629564 n=1 Tax=Bidens hawaiensis TaxID=980011 RepID=UPI00404B356F
MVHKEEMKVMFAEADSNFVDTLFSIMTLPMAAIVRLFRTRPDEEVKPIRSRVYLIFLAIVRRQKKTNGCCLIQELHHMIRRRKSGACLSISSLAKCRYCGKMMDREVKYEDSTSGDDCEGGVFVSDFASYIVTDDLCVMPNSPISIVQLLCELEITAVSFLDEMTIDIGLDQILTLLKGAFLFKYPLTYLVFPSSPVIQDLVNPRQETLFKKLNSRTSTRLPSVVTLQKSTSKVLFVEAGCDFVEFLFRFLEIPLGTMIGELMSGATSFESLNNLYSSISNMSVGDYLKSDDLKKMLLQPQLVHTNLSENQIFPLSVFNYPESYCYTYFCGGHASANLSRFQNNQGYSGGMHSICNFKDSRVDGRYLKTSAKFILSDDLVITPLTSFSSVTMLGKLNVSFNDFEVVKVSIGIDEGLKVLDVALKSVSILTDSILKNNTGN